ncbi:hypothetical protein [Pseudonocardia sp. HH130629-09]|uniref:hypothetical protein n=1 Tax=Pseudonocardia sp. HH130629-09 TaxID=1641402 RepID=UPI0006CB0DBF|nr:hypothetical protein [Pseudonocardia sp. HH130629-09]ALE86395.1 hypothetical protein XF36_27345 [Pseudonocardia sp. HH130629-09]
MDSSQTRDGRSRLRYSTASPATARATRPAWATRSAPLCWIDRKSVSGASSTDPDRVIRHGSAAIRETPTPAVDGAPGDLAVEPRRTRDRGPDPERDDTGVRDRAPLVERGGHRG